MRSLTWLDHTASDLLNRNEFSLRGALNGFQQFYHPLPIILEEDEWNIQASMRPGAFPADVIKHDDPLVSSKKQKLDDELDDMPPLIPRDQPSGDDDMLDLIPLDQLDEPDGSHSAS